MKKTNNFEQIKEFLTWCSANNISKIEVSDWGTVSAEFYPVYNQPKAITQDDIFHALNVTEDDLKETMQLDDPLSYVDPDKVKG